MCSNEKTKLYGYIPLKISEILMNHPLIELNTKLTALVEAVFYFIHYLLHNLFIVIWSNSPTNNRDKTNALKSVQRKVGVTH